MEVMVQKLQAVYEGGVLRPVEALRLDEHQLVSVIIIIDDVAPDEELRFEAPEHFESLADHNVTLETVRGALSKIPGSLDADFLAERNES
jgi:predicted DNA-binding antitoxin AbrB/MazE fold protein